MSFNTKQVLSQNTAFQRTDRMAWIPLTSGVSSRTEPSHYVTKVPENLGQLTVKETASLQPEGWQVDLVQYFTVLLKDFCNKPDPVCSYRASFLKPFLQSLP